MQPLSWYLRRARGMTPAELWWRARSAARDAGDRVRIPLGLVPATGVPLDGSVDRTATPLTDVQPGEWRASAGREGIWRDRLIARAEPLLDHRLGIFDLDDVDLGRPVRWNFDYARGVPTPMGVSSGIDYRDFAVTGDCKVVWEPSRHHQLVVLGRAYRATGDVRFARGVVEQIGSWIDQCPFGRGMQWRSPLELAVRTINWVWADDLIGGPEAFDAADRARFLDSVARHAWEIERKTSRGSSANNHVIGEAAGLFAAACRFPLLPRASRLRAAGAATLEREMLAQVHEDGGCREQAFGYHGFLLQFFLGSVAIGRRAGVEFSPAFLQRLERMLEFAAIMLEGGPPPAFGDADDGYVLDLGARPGDLRDALAVGAALFDRPDLKAASRGHAEPVRWLLGRDGLARFDGLSEPAAGGRLAARAFPQSGYYLLQCGTRGGADAISVLFDCGELGYLALAAHGHADALSFTLRAFGEELLVDPGTYDYFTDAGWRRYFRSTAAHNTAELDGRDQSVMLGPFLWGERAVCRRIEWDPSPGGARVTAEHDGYVRLPDPAVHRRTLHLDAASRSLSIVDEIEAAGEHDVKLSFHAAEHCSVEPSGAGRFVVRGLGGSATIVLDPALAVSAVRGATAPPGGWVSRGYHRKAPSTTLVASCRTSGRARFVCRVDIGSAARGRERGHMFKELHG